LIHGCFEVVKRKAHKAYIYKLH